MNVQINDHQSALQLSHASIKRLVAEALTFEGASCDEVGIHLVDTPTICELHGRYFNDSTSTDCISFPVDEDNPTGYRLLGDIFVCTETAVQYAEQQQLDPYEETALYIVHGLLHLLGYDDLDPDKRSEMRAAEQRHMAHLQQLSVSIRERP